MSDWEPSGVGGEATGSHLSRCPYRQAADKRNHTLPLVTFTGEIVDLGTSIDFGVIFSTFVIAEDYRYTQRISLNPAKGTLKLHFQIPFFYPCPIANFPCANLRDV